MRKSKATLIKEYMIEKGYKFITETGGLTSNLNKPHKTSNLYHSLKSFNLINDDGTVKESVEIRLGAKRQHPKSQGSQILIFDKIDYKNNVLIA